MAFKIPSITSAIPRDLRAFCDRVREALNGQGNDRVITRRDLIASGVVTYGPGNSLQPVDPTELAKVKYATPPAPTGLATSGAIANIILTWDAPNYAGHSYTEIYVADTNTFADRVKLADAPGSVYSHSVGASTTKYYWIRFVNVTEVPGPFNSTTGVSGTTGEDPDYLISVLSDAYGVTSDAPFFQIDTPTIINGVLIPAGTYIKQAFIADATISRAKIQDLAVDDAKITDLNATKINAGFLSAARIQAGSIDASKVSFTVVGTSNVVGTINASVEGIRISGTRIQIDGNVTFSAGYDPTTKIASGGAATDINNNVTTISGGKITTGSITANKISSSAIITNSLKAGTSTVGVNIAGGTSVTNQDGIPITNGVYIYQNNSGLYGLYCKNAVVSSGGGSAYFQSSGGYTIDCYNTGLVGLASTGLRKAGVVASASNGGFVQLGVTKATSGETVYATYAITGAYGPFTGSHDILLHKSEVIELGDILIDLVVVKKKGLNDTLTIGTISTTANQKGAIGVITGRSDFTGNIAVFVSLNEDGTITIDPEAQQYIADYDLSGVNALGEGQINVCGEGGDIEAGDLIVTSSLPGKGMKQSDDIVRAITVAKARESVTFASPTEVKQIACIYLCG